MPTVEPSIPRPSPHPRASSPLLGLHVHHQGDVALNEGEGEEADVATVIAGSHGVLHPEGQESW